MVTQQNVTQERPDRRMAFLSDLDTFRLVVVEGRDTGALADQLQMSLPELCGDVARMKRSLLAKTPTEIDPDEQKRRKNFAEQICAEQIHLCFRLAMRSFRKSLRGVRTVRFEGTGKDAKRPVTTVRMSGGDIKYLHAAARFAQMLKGLPKPALDDSFLAEVDQWEEMEQKAMQREQAELAGLKPEVSPENDQLYTVPMTAADVAIAAERPKNHPEEECSAAAIFGPEQRQPAATNGDVTSSAIKHCVDDMFARRAVEKTETRPVHPTPPAGGKERKEQARKTFFGGPAGP